ncbi:dihydroneopterin aldolase [Allohahella marinimesophila]|uniref:7,8-dihydroneopterin aldolase n=1 Tax=Allohahella marinimesophila TaxID=1054972 RepID=A0ABP7P7X3_9GAMM
MKPVDTIGASIPLRQSVVIQALELDCVIGVYDFERRFEQRLLLDLTMSTDFSEAMKTDRLDQTLNYAAICERLQCIARASSFALLERLMGDLVRCLQDEFGIDHFHMRLRKPGAVAGTAYVGIEIDTRPV